MKILCFLLLTSFFIYARSDVNQNDVDSGPRIVGGTPANLNEIYYQVALMVFPYTNGTSFCGGTIISLKTVLTAAHCVTNRRADSFRVFAGILNFNSTMTNGTTTLGQSRNVSRVTIHEGYKANSFNNDIAVLLLGTPFINAVGVRPIQWRTSSTKKGENCVISGFGTTFTGGNPSNVLLRANVPTVDLSDCKKKYGGSTVTNNMVCAGTGSTDSCQGDSGGPMVCSDRLVGITSFGNVCASPTYPGVYTELAKYTDWIVKNNSFSARASVVSVLLACLLAYLL